MWCIACFLAEQFLKGSLCRQPCERLLASPKRQLLYEGPLTLVGMYKSYKLIYLKEYFVKKHTRRLAFLLSYRTHGLYNGIGKGAWGLQAPPKELWLKNKEGRNKNGYPSQTHPHWSPPPPILKLVYALAINKTPYPWYCTDLCIVTVVV